MGRPNLTTRTTNRSIPLLQFPCRRRHRLPSKWHHSITTTPTRWWWSVGTTTLLAVLLLILAVALRGLVHFNVYYNDYIPIFVISGGDGGGGQFPLDSTTTTVSPFAQQQHQHHDDNSNVTLQLVAVDSIYDLSTAHDSTTTTTIQQPPPHPYHNHHSQNHTNQNISTAVCYKTLFGTMIDIGLILQWIGTYVRTSLELVVSVCVCVCYIHIASHRSCTLFFLPFVSDGDDISSLSSFVGI